MAHVVLEGLLAKRALTGLDALAIEFGPPGGRGDGFGEEHIGVGAIGGNGESLSGQGETFFRVGDFPSVVNQILRLAE